MLEWILEHSGIPGNVVADMAARCVHDYPDMSPVSHSRSVVARVIHRIGVEISSLHRPGTVMARVTTLTQTLRF